MPKNVLFSLKICKNRQKLGVLPQTTLPPAAPPPNLHINPLTLWIFLFASAHKAQTLS